MILSITKEFTFEASHRLPHHDGKCANPHGHSYRLEVTITGSVIESGPKRGMIADFGEIKKIVNEKIIDKIDHQDLNEVFKDMDTTAENLVIEFARVLDGEIFGQNGELSEIKLYETATSCATVKF